MSRRIKTPHVGIYYRNTKRIGGSGIEKVYYIVFKKDDKTIEEKVGRQYVDNMTSAKAARIRAERIENKRLSKKQRLAIELEKKQWTIAILWKEYSSFREDNKGLAVDRNRYEKYILPEFGSKVPSNISPLEVDSFKQRLLKELSPQTVRHILNLLTWIINFGFKKNLCPPLSFQIVKPQVNNIITEDLTATQLINLINAIEEDQNKTAGNIMKMALFTGMRRGEIFKLKWKDINFERKFILIQGPKGGIDQKIPLNRKAEILLTNIDEKDSLYVFPGKAGKQIINIYPALRRIRKRAGIPASFRPLHGLRHYYASAIASSGQVDMYTLQKLLTHKDPRMTQRYAHLRDETLKQAADLAGNIIDDVFNSNK
ncbi:tyrosine-type recombinase/integrase [candidate division KSB1 bacterium]